MIRRWILYLLAVIGCTVFFAFYQGWVAWVLLMLVGLTPLFSLALSLVPMLLVKARPQFPSAVTLGDEERLAIRIHSPLPMPPCRCRFQVRHTLTGKKLAMKAEDELPLDHCGSLLCHCTRFSVYDYLGMFRLRRKGIPDTQVLIRPRPIAMEPPRELEKFLARSWKPKYGGGFAEHHEMRLYRPGDSLNQVHWKLTAKTGKLIVREPMVPQPGRVLLTMDLSGTPEQMDRKLGKLHWMGLHMLKTGLRYEVYVHTGSGKLALPVFSETDLLGAIDTLLTQRPATGGSVLDSTVQASWRYHIGGDDDDA